MSSRSDAPKTGDGASRERVLGGFFLSMMTFAIITNLRGVPSQADSNDFWYPTVLSFTAATIAFAFDPALANNKHGSVVFLLSTTSARRGSCRSSRQ